MSQLDAEVPETLVLVLRSVGPVVGRGIVVVVCEDGDGCGRDRWTGNGGYVAEYVTECSFDERIAM